MMRRKRLLAIFAILLFALSAIALINKFTDYQLPITAHRRKISTQTHTDTERKFSFDYPTTWRYIEEWDLEYRNPKFVVGVMQQDLPGVACGVIVDERPASLKYEPKEAISQLDEVLDYTLQDFRRVSARGFKLKNLPAIEYSYNYTREGTDIYVRLREYIIYAPDKIYTVVCGCPDSDYREFSRDFDLILKSFQVLTPGL